MFGYFFRYFFARASYDLVRDRAQRRLSKATLAQAKANLAQAQERQRAAASALKTARDPTLDDNLLAIGRQHAALGMTLQEVEACYGEGEELPSTTKGIVLRAYRLNAFCVCVSFWKGRSFQETWTKADIEKKGIVSGEILALLENKTPGHLWSPLKSSSQKLWWWASLLGLVGCFEIRETGQTLLHIADPSCGAPPSALPALPAAALPAAALPAPAVSQEEPHGSKMSLGCFVLLALLVLYIMYNVGSAHDPYQAAAPTIPRALPVDSTPAPPRALPVYPPSLSTNSGPNSATAAPSSSPKRSQRRH
jgi:hypothetical protein